jgi:hypothetical protein
MFDDEDEVRGPVWIRKEVTVIWLSINFNLNEEEIKQKIDVYFIIEN